MKRKGLSRREFTKLLGASIGLGFGVSIFNGVYQMARAVGPGKGAPEFLALGTADFKGFKIKEITPNTDFFTISYAGDIPKIDPEKYSLRVEGLVQRPYNLALPEIKKLAIKKEFVTLQCISNPVGGPLIGNALWEGVTLRNLLERATPEKGARDVVFYAADGYSDSIPFELALSDEVFLAVKMNGEELPRDHGFPLRAVVPGIYGMKNVKWISKIEVVNYDYKGFWQKEGWSDMAVMPVRSQIFQPEDGKAIPEGNYVIGGIAYGGKFGVSRVQVSVNGGNWAEAEMKKPLSRWAWTLWRYDWKPKGKNTFNIRVRAFDRTGNVQVSKEMNPYPDGAQGLHSIKVGIR